MLQGTNGQILPVHASRHSLKSNRCHSPSAWHQKYLIWKEPVNQGAAPLQGLGQIVCAALCLTFTLIRTEIDTGSNFTTPKRYTVIHNVVSARDMRANIRPTGSAKTPHMTLIRLRMLLPHLSAYYSWRGGGLKLVNLHKCTSAFVMRVVHVRISI